MEFRLTYEGPLVADRVLNTVKQERRVHKHDIRRHFHKQLRELWKVEGRLKGCWEQKIRLQGTEHTSVLDEMANKNEVRGIKWVPLLDEKWGVACSLNILFLRHEPKGGVIQSGDLDNRIKTLFDALKIPDSDQIPHDLVSATEPNPFFCLLSDDHLITDFRVTADRWLTPAEKPDADVHLVIEVRTFVSDHEKAGHFLGVDFHK